MQNNLKQIEMERANIQDEKAQVLEKKREIDMSIQQQIEIQEKQEEELKLHVNSLKKRCDELTDDLEQMKQSMTHKERAIDQISAENMGLVEEKESLKQVILKNEKLEKQQKRPIDVQRFALRQDEISLVKQTEQIKHLQSGLKREDNVIKSRENKVVKDEQLLKEKKTKQEQQQYDLDRLTQNVQMQILQTQKAQKSAEEAEQIQIEKMKLVTGLQQTLQRAQEASVHKDMLIHELQNKYQEINRTFMKQHGLLIHVEHVQKESMKKEEMKASKVRVEEAPMIKKAKVSQPKSVPLAEAT